MTSVKKLARATGLTYLLMVPLGIMGILYIPAAVLVPGDIAATIESIAAHQGMFHLGIAAGLAGQVVQIFLVLLLYRLLSHASKVAGVVMVATIIPAVSISMLNEVSYLAVAQLVGGAAYTASLTAAQLQGMVGMLLDMHQAGVMIAQIFWGIWLFPMGYLVYRSGYIPRVIGIFLMIACFGYLADSVLYVLGINLGITLSEYTFIGEVLLLFWLIFKADSIAEKHPGISS